MILATSSDGAGDLVRLSLTCKYFKILIEQPRVLSVVNLHRLTSNFDYTKYHSHGDLILQCALARNPIAESILGKAFLYDDSWFWDMPGDTMGVIGGCPSTSGHLYTRKLVRSFILYGSSEDLIHMRSQLIHYVFTLLDFDEDHALGITNAINNMCYNKVTDRENVIVLFDKIYRGYMFMSWDSK